MNLGESSVPELLALYRDILRALRDRGVTRSDNAPTGDYAEYLAAAAYGGELAPASTRSWDVLDSEGRHLQVKGRVGRRPLSVIRSFDFDALVVVLFDDSYAVDVALEVPTETVQRRSSWRAHVNGHVLNVTESLFQDPSVVDVTARFRETAGSAG